MTCSYANIICWICFLFSIIYFLLLCQKSCVHRYVDWYPDLQFNSISTPVCFYVSTRLFSFLKLYNGTWSQKLYCIQKFLHCARLLWISGVFWVSIWIWILFFWGQWRILLGFKWELHWIFRLLLVRLPFLLC